jgi:BirA family biotin operon repressor/biotin-[acetyl-CoA-carboxylase] ligase
VVRAPARDWPASLLPLAAGVAAAVAVEESAGLMPRLKWPNDVLIAGRKAAGLLAEGHAAGVFVVGLGVNLRAQAVPPALRGVATSLEEEADRPVDAAALLATYLDALEELIDGMTVDSGSAVLQAWERRMAGRGEHVAVWPAAGAGPPLEGVAVGLASDGALRVDAPGGETLVYAGDVSLATSAEA